MAQSYIPGGWWHQDGAFESDFSNTNSVAGYKGRLVLQLGPIEYPPFILSPKVRILRPPEAALGLCSKRFYGRLAVESTVMVGHCGQYEAWYAQDQGLDYHGHRGSGGVIWYAADPANYLAASLELDTWPDRWEHLTVPYTGRFVVSRVVNGAASEVGHVHWEMLGWDYGAEAWNYSIAAAELRAECRGSAVTVRCILKHHKWSETPESPWRNDVREIEPIVVEDAAPPKRGWRVGVFGQTDLIEPEQMGTRLYSIPRIYSCVVERLGDGPGGLYSGRHPVHQLVTNNGACAPALSHVAADRDFEENEVGAIILAAGTPYTMLGADRILIGTQAPPAPANPNLFWRSLMLGDIPGVFDPTERPLWRSLVEA